MNKELIPRYGFHCLNMAIDSIVTDPIIFIKNGKYLMIRDESRIIESHDGNGELVFYGRHG